MATDKQIPGWVWVTVPAVTAAFVGFIFFLSTVPAGNELDAVKGDVREALKATADKAKQDAEKLLEETKPVYEFYDLLENQTVDVSELNEYKSTPKDAEPSYQYILQVGSFRSRTDAETMRAELILEGLQAYEQAGDVNGNTWHRVYVGPFTNRSRLNRAQDVLVSLDISPLVIKKKVE